ncbi:MAG: hypothetical protein IJZ46_04085 [Bacilli bacterium]|nr:hypothetical protein [Bacilli bacterium]
MYINDKLIVEIVERIKVLPFNTDITIAELIGYNPDENYVEPIIQGQVFRKVIEMCRKENVCTQYSKDEIGGLAFYSKFTKIDSNK